MFAAADDDDDGGIIVHLCLSARACLAGPRVQQASIYLFSEYVRRM